MSVNDYTRFPLSWMPPRDPLDYPQYLSLAAALERDIASGALPVGTKLPPQRALADYLDLHFTTVTRAYALCREKGLIYGEVGRGTFVAPRTEYEEAGNDAIELGVVLGFPGVTKLVVDAAREVMANRYCRELFSYTDRMGMPHQRAACVHWLAHRGIATDPDHTTIFAGAQNAITTALLSLFHVGDALATDAFTYANLLHAAHLAHVRIVPIPGDAHGMSPQALDEACARQRIHGVFFMPDCANPTTITIPEDRRDALAEVCRRRDLLVLEDDSALFPQCRSFYARIPERTLYIAAVTRHITPGLRVTFACYPDEVKKNLLDGLFATSIKASALDAEIGAQLLVSGRADAILKEKSLLAMRANRIYRRVFPDDPVPANPHAFFRVHELPSHDNGLAVERRLLAQGIRVCHSYRFAAEKNPQRSFLRISVSSTADFAQLEEGLRRLRECV